MNLLHFHRFRLTPILITHTYSKMSDGNNTPAPPELKSRTVGGTEHSWCKAVPGGTGTTVLALLLSKPPNTTDLQNTLHKLQISHPILRSKLHYDSSINTFSYIIPTSPPQLEIQPYDLQSTAHILSSSSSVHVSPLQLILEHEINIGSWSDPYTDTDVLFASVYAVSEGLWAVALRVHTSACDRTSSIWLLREVLSVMCGEEADTKFRGNGEFNLGIEDYIPSGKGNKPFWARGMDMLGYGLNSFRLGNLNFVDTESPRSSQIVRLKMNVDETERIISGCKSRGIKLCGLLAAAGLMAARSTKDLPDEQWEKYSVATLIDCRSLLDPVLAPQDTGFYHSAIINSHDINGNEQLWDLAKRIHDSFSYAKNNNKHFTDMADLNFLMCRAIENPGLTHCSSLRTSVISVFEDSVYDYTNDLHQVIGLEDYIGCASVHGVGPSIAVFDTVRDGALDCVCVYPAPLHSRHQMQGLIDHMKELLVDCINV